MVVLDARGTVVSASAGAAYVLCAAAHDVTLLRPALYIHSMMVKQCSVDRCDSDNVCLCVCVTQVIL